MQKYLVGGAVRDFIMKKEPHDYDYVLVDATPQDIADILANGGSYVGKDFPVFLINGEEHALARTERAKGDLGQQRYTDFEVKTSGVTLVEDLGRRDFTMNAIALDANGSYIDPFGGIADINSKIIRHIHSEAFKEDPLRILRAARFAAQLGFTVHPSTVDLMCNMVLKGMLANLTPERVWKETVKALSSAHPVAYFRTLDAVGALCMVFPELAQLKNVPQPAEHHPEICALEHTYMVLDQAVSLGCTTDGRFAALLHDIGKGLTPRTEWPQHIDHETSGVPLLKAMGQRLMVPSKALSLAQMAMEMHLKVHRVLDTKRPGKLVTLVHDLGGFKNDGGATFNEVLTVCKADAQGRLGFTHRSYPQMDFLKKLRQNILDVRHSNEYTALLESGITGKDFGEKLGILRIKAAQRTIHEFNAKSGINSARCKMC